MRLPQKSRVTNSFTRIGIRAITLAYRGFVSPLLHLLAGPAAGCRFEPGCSRYAEEALLEHGFLRGSLLAMRRVLRCNPWGGSGFDPVPPVQTRKSH